jgi:hypothetical protein
VTKLETFLTPRLLTSKQAFGVIVDADTDPVGISQSLSQALLRITGQQVNPNVWTRDQPKIGFFVTPDGGSQGEIETLVWNAWSNDPGNVGLKGCIDQFVQCMAQNGHTPASRDKGSISALLSIEYDEDPRLGPGARAGKFDFTRPDYSPLKTFLMGL